MKLKVFIASVTLVATASAANVPPVVPPSRRASTLESAQKLLGARDTSVPANVTNPFNSQTFAAASGRGGGQTVPNNPQTPQVDTRPSGPRTDAELLQAIANDLTPSGYIVLGGVPSLAFGQKRVKAGGLLTITFEGTEYTVEVVSIDRTHFTLRLNREEYTRPIK